jgi:DNA-binding response OmpR family regulator
MKKILIVDDEPDVLEFLRNGLKKNNFDAICAADGEEGFRKALTEEPDLILLDLIMPNRDGFTMLQELKTNELTQGIPVIVLSIKSEIDSIYKSQEHGVVDYIIKPCDFQMILKYIKRYI